MHRDPKTEAYFDKRTPEYSTNRFDFAVEFIREQIGDDLRLIDLGCGTGNILDYIRKNTTISHFCGLDVSVNNLAKTTELLGCKTINGSILDPTLPKNLDGKYDIAILAAVLHHLVGNTRQSSFRNALSAIRNASGYIKPGGYLIIVEPVFYPARIMDLVFYIKKLTTSITSRRIPIFGKWNNIGAPVVSFLTNEQLQKMVDELHDCTLQTLHTRDRKVSLVMSLGFIYRYCDTTIILKKNEIPVEGS
jgi:SAM-dependent methyltransferase